MQREYFKDAFLLPLAIGMAACWRSRPCSAS